MTAAVGLALSNVESLVKVQICHVQKAMPALTGQTQGSGILPLICCHEAALCRREETKREIKVIQLSEIVQGAKQPAVYAVVGSSDI